MQVKIGPNKKHDLRERLQMVMWCLNEALEPCPIFDRSAYLPEAEKYLTELFQDRIVQMEEIVTTDVRE